MTQADIAGFIEAHYAALSPAPRPKFQLAGDEVLTNVCQGLGDTLLITDLPRASIGRHQAYSYGPHFKPLMKFNPWFKEVDCKPRLLFAPDVLNRYDNGNGHYFQRLRRLFGCPVEALPKPCVSWKGTRFKSRVILHFEPGPHARWQQIHVHTKARQLYPETRASLERFIVEQPNCEFIQIGHADLRIKKAKYIPCPSTESLVNLVGSAGWFIGIISGPMHLATALGLKCVVVLNFPSAAKVVLPALKHTGLIEEGWLYPQNVHLHQDDESPLVRHATDLNLHRAFNGELYPFWKPDWLGMVTGSQSSPVSDNGQHDYSQSG